MKNALLTLSLLTAFNLAALAQQRPNVIMIVVDDLNIGFDAYGNPNAKAPNFARLASHGVLFKTTYVQYPLCSPSRTSILSGQRPDATGIYNNKREPRDVLGANFRFLPEYFQDNNYRTERVGHIGPCNHEHTVTWDYEVEVRGDGFDHDGSPEWWIDTVYKTDRETKPGVGVSTFLQRLKSPVETPYFYGLGLRTHNPFTPNLIDWNKTGDPTVKQPLPIDRQHNYTNVFGNGSGNIVIPNTPANDLDDIPPIALKQLMVYPDDEWRRLRHAYSGEIIQTDNLLGDVLDEIDRQNLWENSIIVFFSDHGLHMGEHQGLWLKGTCFEESLRVPFVICAPGKKRGVVCERPVEMVDLFPTLTELCNLPLRKDLQGSSLVPLLENPAAEWKKAVFGQVNRSLSDEFRGGRAVRTEQYSYRSWIDGTQGEELYDIVKDPYEYTNLAGNPDYKSTLNEMRILLARDWKGALPPDYKKQTFYQDKDGDGYGSDVTTTAYFAPDGYVERGGDCDDTNGKINPGAKEKACNGKDDNCDGRIDEGLPVPPIHASGNGDICQTGSVTLKTVNGSGFTYKWFKNNVAIPGADAKKYVATSTGTYTVFVAQKDKGCGNMSAPVMVTNSCPKFSGTQSDEMEIAEDAINVYPSPSKGNLTVEYRSTGTQNVSLKVTDLAGKLLYTATENTVKGNNSFRLNLSNLSSGIYYLQINNGKQTLMKKFVIEK